jgi:hypothetical protein
MKNVGHLNSYQQTLLSVLAILDEAEVIGVFRALRHAPDRNEVIDLANEELDKGRSLFEMLASGPLYTLLANNHLQMRACILRNGRISIDIGTGGEECGMGTWTFAVDGAGQIHDIESNGTWNEFHRGHPFNTSIYLS